MDKIADVNILVVDDEQELRDLVCEYLEKKGFQTSRASSGNSAIEVMKEAKVDVIISDVRMADGTGVELLSYVKSNKSEIPFFFMTGFSEISEERLLSNGASALFVKPIDRKQIYTTICKHLKLEDA